MDHLNDRSCCIGEPPVRLHDDLSVCFSHLIRSNDPSVRRFAETLIAHAGEVVQVIHRFEGAYTIEIEGRGFHVSAGYVDNIMDAIKNLAALRKDNQHVA